MAKKAKQERIEQFRKDLATLREKYSNNEIAGKLGINPANLSSYLYGKKNPGEKTINKLYMHFEDELKKPQDYQPGSAEDTRPSPEAEDPASLVFTHQDKSRFTTEQLWADKKQLQAEKEWLQKKVDQVIDNNTEMVKGTRQLINNNEKLTRITEMLVTRYAPKSYPIRKSPKP
jgi:transcriptional regulator with XRE-family HTH domain